jgi:hypothetical protein
VPQLYRRKFTETLADLILSTFEEDPARLVVAVAAQEVEPAPDRVDGCVRLELEVDLPSVVTTPQLAHVARAIVTRKWGTHFDPSSLPGPNAVG